MELTIMTFNLRVNVEQDGDNAWPKRVKQAAEAIKDAGTMIVCTQEGTYPMLQDLQEILPEYRWSGEGRQGGNKDEHCAVFYRRDLLELVESGNFGLSEFPEHLGYMSWNTNCPRMCTWVQLRQHDGQEWYVFNTHLDHISEEARTKGIQLIVKRMNEMNGRDGIPAVLTGDFNCGPESDVITILDQSGFINAYSILSGKSASVGQTFHGFNGGDTGEPIDYIFVTPEVQITSVQVDRSMYNGRYPSDHYPVTARVETNH